MKLRSLCAIALLFSSSLWADESIVGKTWYLTSMNSVPIELMDFKQEKPFLMLMEENRYSAYAGCNRIMGGFTLESNQISFSGGAMTMMACQQNMDFEQKFVKTLEQVKYWTADGEGHTLNLKGSDLGTLLVFDDSLPEPIKYEAVGMPADGDSNATNGN